MATITGILYDQPPADQVNLLELALPITDLPNINSESDWAQDGIHVAYRCSCAARWPVQGKCYACVPEDVVAPDWWPTPLSAEDNPSGQFGMPDGPAPSTGDGILWKKFNVGRLHAHNEKGVGCDFENVAETTAADIAAHTPAVLGAELYDGAGSLSGGLMECAELIEVDGGGAVSPGQAVASLIQNVTSSSEDGKHYSAGGYVISIPEHAGEAFNKSRRATEADIPVWRVAGNPNMGPYETDNDYTSGLEAGPGQAWAYIHPVPYVGVTQPKELDDSIPTGNLEMASEQRRYIVAFKPCRIYAILVDINIGC